MNKRLKANNDLSLHSISCVAFRVHKEQTVKDRGKRDNNDFIAMTSYYINRLHVTNLSNLR